MFGEAEKKFSLPESIIMVLICLFADTAELFFYFLSIIPFFSPVSIVISWFINTFVFGIVYLWLIIKGGKKAWFLAGGLVEFIPFLNLLPLKTLTVIIAIVLSNNPALNKTANLASGKMSEKSKINVDGNKNKIGNKKNKENSQNEKVS